MSLTPKKNNTSLAKFESMLKTNNVYFFDSIEFEEIIYYYLDLGKNSLAKKAIKLGLVQHPNSMMLKLLKAEIMIFDGKLDKASILLKEIEAIEPTNEEVYIQQAIIFSKKDNHKAAIDTLKIALNFTDDIADILSMMGMEYLFLDNFDKARLNFVKCLEIDFEDYSSLYNVIYCFDMEEKHIEAVDYLNIYINKDPYNEVAWHQLGRQYFILKRYEEALKAFEYAVLIDEHFVGGFLEMAKTLEQLKRYEDAIKNYKVTIKLDDPTSFAFLRIGKCYEKLENKLLSMQYYKKAVHEDPLLDKAWVAMTTILIIENKFEKALYTIKKAIEIDEQNTLYWRKFAQINLKLDFYEEAIKGFEECIKNQDLSLEIWVGLCDVQCFIGEYEDALKTLLNAKAYFYDFAEIEFRLSGLYFKFKNNHKGKLHLIHAITINYGLLSILKEQFREVYKLNEVQQIITNFKDISI